MNKDTIPSRLFIVHKLTAISILVSVPKSEAKGTISGGLNIHDIFRLFSFLNCTRLLVERYSYTKLIHPLALSKMPVRMKPLLFSMGSYGVMYAASDICQQKVISKKENLDLSKTARTSCVGFMAIAPLVYSWLRLAEFVVPGRAVLSVVKKVLAEQLLFAPVALTTFYTGKRSQNHAAGLCVSCTQVLVYIVLCSPGS